LLQSETDATKVNPRKNLYMMFTCGVCETRAAKGFSRQAYENGVVIVRCPGCQNQHLVADHEGWFGDKGTIEDFLKLRGARSQAFPNPDTVYTMPLLNRSSVLLPATTVHLS
jgi:protein import protein ZIM17|tara:strand:- start:1286 stop:1621 length:336 start_codon:yes stop_codon:yes gene_type:complete